MKVLTNFLSRTQIISLLFSAVFVILSFLISQLVLQALMAGIATSFVFTFIFDSFEVYLQRLDKRHFRGFFSEAAISQRLYLVYPTFILSNEVRDILRSHNAQLIYQKFEPKFSQVYRVDVPHAVAENDLHALVYLVGLFGDVCKKAPPIRVDLEAVTHSNDSFISLGLSSNECTHMYLQHCVKPMFEIVPDGNGSEYLAYIDTKGQKREFKSTSNVYYAIILKYHPDPEEEPDRHWFLCAGLGPNGTSGAAWYLANRWRHLYRKIGTSDFIAIIKVQHYSDSDSSLVDIRKRDDI